MSGLLGIVSRTSLERIDLSYLTETVNLLNNLLVRSVKESQYLFAASSLPCTPLKGKRILHDKNWLISFAGDLIDCKEIPFSKIIINLEKRDFDFFKELEGIFSIAAYDKDKKKLYLISDRRSQQPFYYLMDNEKIYFSTEMSTFCRLQKGLEFNENWFWEYLFFNFPVGNTTFLKGVKRMLPASIIEYDHNSNSFSIFEYAEMFRRKPDLIGGREALELASEVFSERVPGYFKGANEVACALTGGWDSRTMLALAPDLNSVTAYTYGVPGCADLKGGRKTARLANVKHMEIHFNDDLIKKLQDYMLDTVYLSSGLEKVTRASLLYNYRNLTGEGIKFPLTISGIALDMEFRGHAFSPSLISSDMACLFKGKTKDMRKEFWQQVLEVNYLLFQKHILDKLKYLKGKYGSFNTTEHHLSYIIYILSTKYFCGELKIAGNFTTLRVPCWDSKIIDLSYSIKPSTLSFSQFSEHKRGGIEEVILQSYLLNKLSPGFSRIPVVNTRPDIVLRGKTAYQIYRIYKGLTRRLYGRISGKKNNPPLENWGYWLGDIHKDFIDHLIFSESSRIRKYISDKYMESIKSIKDTYWIGKFATAEIIIRLIENNWERYW